MSLAYTYVVWDNLGGNNCIRKIVNYDGQFLKLSYIFCFRLDFQPFCELGGGQITGLP